MSLTNRLQQSYAFAFFALRDFFKLSPFDSAYNWKAGVAIMFSEFNFASVAVSTLSMATGWDVLLRSTGALIICLTGIWLVCWWAHATAEKRFVHGFEGEFRRLPKPQRIAMTIGVLTFVVLSVWAVGRTGIAIHKYRAQAA